MMRMNIGNGRTVVAFVVMGRGRMPLIMRPDGSIAAYANGIGEPWIPCVDSDRVYEHADGCTTTHDPDDPIWRNGCTCDACMAVASTAEWDGIPIPHV